MRVAYTLLVTYRVSRDGMCHTSGECSLR